jgi:uncharacterized lipoprotein YajG|tara:strand:- start:239 stop:550 length:312 start_codon:yes stop_codon:yes gene_type:complete
MMPTYPWHLAVPAACALMIASCAGLPPPSAPEPPQLTLPQAATTPCSLTRLAEAPTLADLEVAYMTRGGDLLACDAARQLAVDTLLAERALLARWRRALDRRP